MCLKPTPALLYCLTRFMSAFSLLHFPTLSHIFHICSTHVATTISQCMPTSCRDFWQISMYFHHVYAWWKWKRLRVSRSLAFLTSMCHIWNLSIFNIFFSSTLHIYLHFCPDRQIVFYLAELVTALKSGEVLQFSLSQSHCQKCHRNECSRCLQSSNSAELAFPLSPLYCIKPQFSTKWFSFQV